MPGLTGARRFFAVVAAGIVIIAGVVARFIKLVVHLDLVRFLFSAQSAEGLDEAWPRHIPMWIHLEHFTKFIHSFRKDMELAQSVTQILARAILRGAKALALLRASSACWEKRRFV